MIGGEYYLYPELLGKEIKNSFYDYLGNNINNIEYFSTGRDAIFTLVNSLKSKRIWLPNYLCKSIYDPIKKTEKEILFYKINIDLSISDNFVNKVKDKDVIFIINYFGIIQNNFYERLKRKDIKIISDITHSLININKISYIFINSDFVISSLRKIGPFPDGAFLGSNTFNLPVSEDSIREDFSLRRAGAMLSRGYSKINNYENDENFEIFLKMEEKLNNTKKYGYRISYFSRNILKRIDFKELYLKTKNNFSYLKNNIKTNKKLKIINKQYLSQFIILFCNTENYRDCIRNKLANSKIFCPIHWDMSWLIKENNISNRILSIPCDYRYNLADMKSITSKLNKVSEDI
jgi:hypothetical protein